MAEIIAVEIENREPDAVENGNRRTRRCYLPVTIEPAVFLLCLSSTLTLSVTTNLFLVHTCENNLGFNHSDCLALGDKTLNDSQGLEAIVQREATYYTLGKLLIDSFVPAIISFYIGSWSDLNGRKPLIMWPILGYSLTYVIYLVESLFPKLPVLVLMVSGLPSALSGGFMTFLAGSYSYISDVSEPDKRTLRIGIVNAAYLSGLLVGQFSISYIYNGSGSWGYVTVYAVGTTCGVLGWLHCLLFVKESVSNTSQSCVPTGIFKKHFVTDMFKSCFQRRPNNLRTILLTVIFVLTCYLGINEGEIAVEFLFTREKFHWDLQNYTMFVGITVAMNTLGIFFGVYIFNSYLDISPTTLTAASSIFKIIAEVLRAISPSSWYLYLGSVIGIPAACISPWCRSILSNSVPSSEIGKVFGFLGSMETLVPLAVSPLYTMLYNKTIWSFPGSFCLLSAGGFIVIFLLMIGVMVLQTINDDNEHFHAHSINPEETASPSGSD